MTDAAGHAPRPGGLRSLLFPAATALAGCAAAAVVWFADPTSDAGFPLPPCPVKLLFGLDCPGCGATRMVYSLLHGDVLSALHYNAVALAFIPFFLWTWGAWVLGRWRGRRVITWEHWRWSPLVALIVIAVWSVVRNLPFPPFEWLYV
ncbi:uncharacterized protein DUF2752 [Saccharopolyspora erythraea NRRL 2338]|uniref:Uncharacterized protein n=2 Tax=Saccharopolyspora erythraea TaxID=1836 RepID=A4F9T7_SACEN|nr:DUF2752 domain-containing protein [Saccharopolyspora erythraea]EQD83377.1 membrane protein [Saccharopolyspora erythraea D]PFG94600.1 uncharacterized protein DUF2752 [Saccharopolyspora erythraea NRRL 2338]QRK91336.1 DUF2752 domain-containing protein [Saccharopolyspora erythraea]CAM00812.1 hypothetical protein SACE_1490 [Saccharopolyspora erythraea NRRL 2338]